MPRMLVVMASLLLWSLLMFMTGWRWRGDRSDLAMARADVEQQAGRCSPNGGCAGIRKNGARRWPHWGNYMNRIVSARPRWMPM